MLHRIRGGDPLAGGTWICRWRVATIDGPDMIHQGRRVRRCQTANQKCGTLLEMAVYFSWRISSDFSLLLKERGNCRCRSFPACWSVLIAGSASCCTPAFEAKADWICPGRGTSTAQRQIVHNRVQQIRINENRGLLGYLPCRPLTTSTAASGVSRASSTSRLYGR